MGIKSIGASLFSNWVVRQNHKWSSRPFDTQEKVFEQLLLKARETRFGRDHKLDQVSDHKTYKEAVQIRDYEGIKHYIDRILNGEKDVLWPGRPLYFSKTSGTTSGVKYIPIVKEAMPNFINAARDVLLNYANLTGNSSFFDGRLIFLSGSPEMEKTGDILTGRLSGIVNHFIPFYLKGNQVPSYETNCIDDWEKKIEAIANETIHLDMRLVSGIPPWMQMYFDLLVEKSNKPVGELFPNLSVISHGGVNFDPYKARLFESIGRTIDTLETFPASEGFFAYQDVPDGMKEKNEDDGLLLLLNNGIFYEFIPVSEFYDEAPSRIGIEDVELGVNYVMILNTNSGLWGYNLGDTVKFISKEPYRLKVSGRLKDFISAFGEHVIAEEVDRAITKVSELMNVEIVEFTVAPQVNPQDGLPYHEWFVEFGKPPSDIATFATQLDEELIRLNTYYKDLIDGKVLQRLKLRHLKKDSFINYMRSIGKLGGQNKVPRLSNDRKIVDALKGYVLK